MKLAIIGQGGHSKVIRDIVFEKKEMEIIGYFDDKYHSDDFQHGLYYGPVRSVINFLDKNEKIKIIIAIGNNSVRKKMVEVLNLDERYYVTLIHPSAVISSSAYLGYGTVVMANAVVNADAVIGNHSIINTGSIIEHDSIVEDFVHICPKGTLTGNVTIKEGVQVGAGASIIPQKSVGEWSVIGAGATVINCIPDYCTAVGTPAKIIHNQRLGGGAVAK
jgi:acetyltransferase EpsM